MCVVMVLDSDTKEGLTLMVDMEQGLVCSLLPFMVLDCNTINRLDKHYRSYQGTETVAFQP